MKIIHQNGFTNSAQTIVLAMRKIGLDCVDPNNRVPFNSFTPNLLLGPHLRHLRSTQTVSLTAELTHHPLSFFLLILPKLSTKDPIIPQLMDHTHEFYLMDSAV